MLFQANAALNCEKKAGGERLEMGKMEAVWELQENSGNMKAGMCSSAVASKRTVAASWILPKLKERLLCQVAGFVPPVADSNLCFLTSGHPLQLK